MGGKAGLEILKKSQVAILRVSKKEMVAKVKKVTKVTTKPELLSHQSFSCNIDCICHNFEPWKGCVWLLTEAND